MNGRWGEVAVGAALLLVVAAALAWVYAGTGRSAVAGYPVVAQFSRVDGLSVGADVRLSGMTVGKVVAHRLAEGYTPVVVMRIAPGVPLTADTAAMIHTDGLLGPKYVELQPGGEEETIRPGGRIRYTQDAVVLEELLGKIVSEAKAKRGAAGGPEN